MTWITDGDGTHWVEAPVRSRRSRPRALRFADIQVGDQILRSPQESWHRKVPVYYMVTDLWFDPVLGQDDEIAGRMVGYARIDEKGIVGPRKSSTTVRGLASQQFHPADIDYVAHYKARAAQVAEGKVVGIGHGATIRRRPKTSGL